MNATVSSIKTAPDASNIPAIQRMLLNAYEWGVTHGYITFDADGQPVFAVPESGLQKAEGKRQGADGAEVRA